MTTVSHEALINNSDIINFVSLEKRSLSLNGKLFQVIEATYNLGSENAKAFVHFNTKWRFTEDEAKKNLQLLSKLILKHQTEKARKKEKKMSCCPDITLLADPSLLDPESLLSEKDFLQLHSNISKAAEGALRSFYPKLKIGAVLIKPRDFQEGQIIHVSDKAEHVDPNFVAEIYANVLREFNILLK